MKKLISLLLLLIASVLPQEKTAIDTTWQKEAVGSFSFSQAYFDNWAIGGENAGAYQFDLSGKLVRKNDQYVWINTGKIAFGNSKIGEADTKKNY